MLSAPRSRPHIVGRIHRGRLMVARQCAWCDRWSTVYDRMLYEVFHAPVSHGFCPKCRAAFDKASA